MGQKRGSGTVPRYKCIRIGVRDPKNGHFWAILGPLFGGPLTKMAQIISYCEGFPAKTCQKGVWNRQKRVKNGAKMGSTFWPFFPGPASG